MKNRNWKRTSHTQSWRVPGQLTSVELLFSLLILTNDMDIYREIDINNWMPWSADYFHFSFFLHNIRSVQNNTSIHTTTVCFHGWCYNKNWLDKLIRKSHIGQGWLYIMMTSYLFFFLFTHSRFVEIQEQDIVFFFLQFLKVGVLMVLV
jgi:hypothetical protein